MRASDPLLTAFRYLVLPAILFTLYIYYYPVAQNCAFPPAKRGEAACYRDGTPAVRGEIAPFRLLAFADPQLEGDSSLPDPDAAALPHLGHVWDSFVRAHVGALGKAVKEVLVHDVPMALLAQKKALDLWGNDRYLAHIARSVSWWTQPTHAVVLGDLLGSQWISDDEFDRRAGRFWKTVFKFGKPVPRGVTDMSGRVEVLGKDERWQKRIIAVAGNHDIGYAGDVDEHRIDRFEQTFGSVNWETRFKLNTTKSPLAALLAPELIASPPELRIVVLNSMNLDGPAFHPHLRDRSLQFLEHHVTNPTPPLSPQSATILLTHIPLHKPNGICVDPPFFDYFPASQGSGIKEQNHLSEDISAQILDGLTSQGRKAVVLAGHDHEGCDVWHYEAPAEEAESTSTPWTAEHYHFYRRGVVPKDSTGMREITVRSMMGSFGGNAGLLSAWYDGEDEAWKFAYATCPLGIQHFWWGVHVLDVVVVGLGLGGLAALAWEESFARSHRSQTASKSKVA